MRKRSPIDALQSSTRMLVRDTIELAELQLQLFAADGREMARKSAPPLLIVVAGVVFAMSALPLLLVGLAYALVELAGFSIWLGMISAAVAGIVIGAVAILAGIKWLQPQLTIWQRSANELRENVEFLKGTLNDPAPVERGPGDAPRA